MPPKYNALKNEIVFFQKGIPDSICPFLGTEIEPETHFQYSCEWNYCHKSGKPTQILTTHQDDFCLTERHKNCVVYKQASRDINPQVGSRRSETGKESAGYSHTKLLYTIAGLLFISFLIFGVYRYLEARSSGDVGLFSSIAFVHHDIETSSAAGLSDTALPANCRPMTGPRTLLHVQPASACQPGAILFPTEGWDPKNLPQFESHRISIASFQSGWVG